MQTRELTISSRYIWFGDLPASSCYSPSAFKECVLEKQPTLSSDVRSVCLYLFLPSFNMNSGILGTRFSPNNSKELQVRVGVLDEIDPEKPVNAGLPSNLAEIVINEAILSLERVRFLGSGVLEFACASWDQVDSSPFIFRFLTRCVISLLDPQYEAASEKEIMQVIRNELKDILAKYR
jgi:hypothetical protein